MVSQTVPHSVGYALLTKPLITQIAYHFEVQYGAPDGYRKFWTLEHMAASYYARWWVAWLLWAICDFSYYFDVKGIEMRLDFPDILREYAGNPIKLPFHGWVMNKIADNIKPLMVRKI